MSKQTSKLQLRLYAFKTNKKGKNKNNANNKFKISKHINVKAGKGYKHIMG